LQEVCLECTMARRIR